MRLKGSGNPTHNLTDDTARATSSWTRLCFRSPSPPEDLTPHGLMTSSVDGWMWTSWSGSTSPHPSVKSGFQIRFRQSRSVSLLRRIFVFFHTLRIKMTLFGVALALLLSVCGSFAAAAENVTQSVVPGPTAGNSTAQPPGAVSTGTRTANGTAKGPEGDFGVTSSMMQRALYVLIGITMVGVLYFLVRAVRLKKPVHKKKYGLLSNYDESLEMDGDDSDEDDTLYEARSLRR